MVLKNQIREFSAQFFCNLRLNIEENIMVICYECHKKVHGSEKVEEPSENEIEEVE